MPDLLDDEAADSSLSQVLSLARLWTDLRTYYGLLFVLIVIAIGAVVVVVSLKQPEYTATAIVGPADNSDLPIAQGLGNALGGGLGGIAKHLHASGMLGQGGLDNAFDEYTSLLNSNRLAAILVRKDRILPQIFSADWDPVHGRWLAHNDFVHTSIDYLKTMLRRPVKAAPDQDDLAKYFEENLSVDPSLETSFVTVSFRFRSPEGAEQILGLILREADNVIREDKRRDVAARITYLNAALEHMALAEQKPELIDVLSDQQQEMMIVESDHLFASTMIDLPHAPLKPTSPSPIEDGAIALGLACFVWLGLVRMVPAESGFGRMLAVFAWAGRGRAGRRARAAVVYEPDPLSDALRMPTRFGPGEETSARSSR